MCLDDIRIVYHVLRWTAWKKGMWDSLNQSQQYLAHTSFCRLSTQQAGQVHSSTMEPGNFSGGQLQRLLSVCLWGWGAHLISSLPDFGGISSLSSLAGSGSQTWQPSSQWSSQFLMSCIVTSLSVF